MTEYKCGNCNEVQILSPKARFCAYCGSSSLNLVIKEQMEPSARETLGVYSPPPSFTELSGIPASDVSIVELGPAEEIKEEEDRPRRRRR